MLCIGVTYLHYLYKLKNKVIKQEVLLNGLKENDKQSIDFIYESCFPMVRNLVQKNNGSLENAEDLFQEAIIVLYQNLLSRKDFFLTCSISTYLYEVSRRLWLKHLNKNGKTIHIDNTTTDFLVEKIVDVKPDIEEHEQFDSRLQNLQTAMGKLGEPCSSILKAYYNDNKSMHDIATIFGYTNEDSAKNQKYKCLIRLKKIFFHPTEQKN